MKLDEVVAWYQKKIGTYDKQLWEKTVEQKILDGFGGNVTLKNAKLKTELIDVDLVRGSTFPKAKSKQALITVIRLAVLRYFFLPLYAQWWVKQTSPNTFALIFFLYITQMVNWAIYMFNINRLEASVCCHQSSAIVSSERINETRPVINFPSASAKYVDVNKQVNEHIVSLSELLIPTTLSLLISLIHSQIVATNSAAAAGGNKKRRRYSNANVAAGKPATRESRPRRRKKLVKIRQPEVVDTLHTASNTVLTKRANINPKNVGGAVTGAETLANPQSQPPDVDKAAFSGMKPNSAVQTTSTNKEEVFLTTTAITSLHPTIISKTSATCKPTQLDLKYVLTDSNNTTDNQLRKRNVNWHSPLHDYSTIEPYQSAEQTAPQTRSIATQAAVVSSSCSSSDQTSQTNSETTTPMLNEVASETQQTTSCTTTEQVATTSAGYSHLQPNTVFNKRRNVGEDDGFESLNGKSSSGEDNHSALTTDITSNALHTTATVSNSTQETPNTGQSSNPLRLRLNASSDKKSTGRITAATSSEETDEEDDDGDMISSPASGGNNECTTSAAEWLGITTNSEDCCSYSSELDQSDGFKSHALTDDENCDFTPTIILNAHGSTDRISCTIWEQRDIKKAQMSVLEISSCIIERVESMAETNDYIYIGLCFSVLLSLIPTFCRLCEVTLDSDKPSEINYFDLPILLWEKASFSFYTLFRFAFGNTQWERALLIMAFIQRLCLTLILFMIFGVAERTFKQRFLYAKLFSHLTSSRRARKSNLPHFRLNKVRNIKTWLSVRSYLKKRGPQRSVDIIVSAAFIVTLLLLAFLSVEWLKDSVHLHSQLNLEALMWSITIGIFLLRFMTLGNKIHQKYRSISVLITEQINLYLQIEQKPKKKDELMVSNSVLKLAADLLKELETPFKISGLSANPYLFTTIKVVILSALSGVLSEVLGFKLKLHKIKIK